MPSRRESDNVGLVHGNWGEDRAVEYLRARGYIILERNARPCPWDGRYELDIIAYERESETAVFVEVKQHLARSPYQHRLRSICRHKRELLRTAARSWLRSNRWESGYRFDVIEVYGDPESSAEPEIDHIERVQLFEDAKKFVDWAAA